MAVVTLQMFGPWRKVIHVLLIENGEGNDSGHRVWDTNTWVLAPVEYNKTSESEKQVRVAGKTAEAT